MLNCMIYVMLDGCEDASTRSDAGQLAKTTRTRSALSVEDTQRCHAVSRDLSFRHGSIPVRRFIVAGVTCAGFAVRYA